HKHRRAQEDQRRLQGACGLRHHVSEPAAGLAAVCWGAGSLRRMKVPFAIRLCLLAAMLMSAPAYADWMPSAPVRMLTTFSAGSGPDIVARLVAEELTKVWKHQVIVEPRPGASGGLAVDALNKSKPDGHTIILMGSGELTINPAMSAAPTFKAS